MKPSNSHPTPDQPSIPKSHYFRFHLPHAHLAPVFGNDWFAIRAEEFARFFGTPVFLIAQTLIVAIWIGLNAVGFCKFDVYPFILLNLAFSLQAAYAAPLILLAQTRQADRDKAHAEADAEHREDLAKASEERQQLAEIQKIIDAEKSDLFDVLAYVAYAVAPITRKDRADHAQVYINTKFPAKQQAFLNFVLFHYVSEGVQ